MSSTTRNDHYDAVVIGSGPNGLAAAITLAKHGRSVLVIEAQDKPGGAVATEELTLPGFWHDTYSAVYPAGAASPVFTHMPLEQHGLQWVHPPVLMAHPLPDGHAVALYRDIQRTAAGLEALCPGDGTRWQTFIGPYFTHFTALRDIILAPFPPVRGGLKTLASLGITRTLELARVALLPVTALGEELFQGDGARAWLTGSALHGDVPPWEAGSAITSFYLDLLGHGVGWPSPRGGAGKLVEALVGYLQHLGGEIRLGVAVERVLTGRDGAAVRGVLAGSEEVQAGIVIADLMPRELLRLTGEALAPLYRRRLQRYTYGAQTVKVDWALSAPIPWTAHEARQAGTVHVGGTHAEIHDSIRRHLRGELPERPFLLLGQQSLADPTRAPAGQHTAWAYTHVPVGIAWQHEREVFVTCMEQQIERFAPGFRDRILARHTLTPEEFEHRNRNLIGGDVGGGSYRLDQLIFRPVPSLAPYRTPVRGLYLGSAATFPGGGVHGVCGYAAARLALRETRARRFW